MFDVHQFLSRLNWPLFTFDRPSTFTEPHCTADLAKNIFFELRVPGINPVEKMCHGTLRVCIECAMAHIIFEAKRVPAETRS